MNGKQSNNYFRLHTDRCDVISLLSIRQAAKGGTSRVCSAVSVYNEMLRRFPGLVPLLFENMDRIWEGENGVYSYPAWCVCAPHIQPPPDLPSGPHAGSLQGEYRAGGRAHTPSQAAPPVGRHLLPPGSSTCFAPFLLCFRLCSPSGRMALAVVVYRARAASCHTGRLVPPPRHTHLRHRFLPTITFHHLNVFTQRHPPLKLLAEWGRGR